MGWCKNLAGYSRATERFEEELRAAGLQAVPSINPDGETRAAVDGFADLGGGFTLRVVRRWVYSSPTIDPALPAEAAAEVNELPFNHDGSHYSGTEQTLGAVARAHGFSGGLPDEQVLEWGPCRGWHCDSTEALAALVVGLREMIARRGLTAEAVLVVGGTPERPVLATVYRRMDGREA